MPQKCPKNPIYCTYKKYFLQKSQKPALCKVLNYQYIESKNNSKNQKFLSKQRKKWPIIVRTKNKNGQKSLFIVRTKNAFLIIVRTENSKIYIKIELLYVQKMLF